MVVGLIREAVVAGARLFKACEVVGISTRTFQRWGGGSLRDRRKGAAKRVANKLPLAIVEEIVTVACSDRFKKDTPTEIVVKLLEGNRYVASPRSFYRVLRARGLLKKRTDWKAPAKRYRPPELVATACDQVWCWDITYLPSLVAGIFFYAYVVMDIWSRKIVGWEIHDRECPELATGVFHRMASRLGHLAHHLHSDNGNPMKGMSLLALLYSLGVMPSYSRPRVSNDNPYSESLFRTTKFRPGYPGRFASIERAREWFADFVVWYNEEHRHSGIGYVTPSQRHSGQDIELFARRNRTIGIARAFKPIDGHRLRDWKRPARVVLNPAADSQPRRHLC